MECNFTSYDDFLEEYKCYRLDKCSECGGICELEETYLTCSIEGRLLNFPQMLVLKCKKCGREFLPQHTKQMIDGAYKATVEANQIGGEFRPKGYKKKFNYCIDVNYDYDHRDFYNVPGLCYDDEHSVEGFLTPVYFEKEALVYFLAIPDYEVEIFSESYGYFAKKDPTGYYQYEWNVPFGFNSNGRLVMWLGDIADMDVKTKTILKAFNIPSDHKLIDSEFYQAQMNCVFSQPIIEKRILQNKEAFIANINNKYQIDISHLTDECIEHEKKVKRPVIFTESTVSEVVNAFDKILIEGFNVGQMKILYEKLYTPTERVRNYGDLQSIKLIEAILTKLSSSVTNMDISTVMSPLYLLRDYRIFFDHLLSADKINDTKQHIVDTLGVTSFEDQEAIYNEEIKRLDTLFNYLAILSK